MAINNYLYKKKEEYYQDLKKKILTVNSCKKASKM